MNPDQIVGGGFMFLPPTPRPRNRHHALRGGGQGPGAHHHGKKKGQFQRSFRHKASFLFQVCPPLGAVSSAPHAPAPTAAWAGAMPTTTTITTPASPSPPSPPLPAAPPQPRIRGQHDLQQRSLAQRRRRVRVRPEVLTISHIVAW